MRDESIDRPGDITWPDADTWYTALLHSPLTRRPDEDTVTPNLRRPPGLSGSILVVSTAPCGQVVMRLEQRIPIHDEARFQERLNALFPPNPDIPGEDRQKTAADVAARRGFSIITGGPGTGKTTTIQRLLAILIQDAWMGGKATPRFALMAPTGKAAARMKESFGSETGVPHCSI